MVNIFIQKFKDVAAIVFKAIVHPQEIFKDDESSLSGIKFFLMIYGSFCFFPLFFLNLFESLLELLIPDLFYFQDINPWTLVIVMPLYFLLGPISLFIFSHAYSWGNTFNSSDAELKKKTGWYVGTFLVVFKFWFLGLGVALYNIGFMNVIDRNETLLTLGMFAAIVLGVWVAVSATKISLKTTYGNAILGVAASSCIYFFIVFILTRIILLIF